MMYYTLDDKHQIVPTTDIMVWGKFRQDHSRRRVAATQVGTIWVSTVFLGIDHGLGEITGERPVLFETMAFADTNGEDKSKLGDEIETCRYCTWDEAVAGHAEMVARLSENGEAK